MLDHIGDRADRQEDVAENGHEGRDQDRPVPAEVDVRDVATCQRGAVASGAA